MSIEELYQQYETAIEKQKKIIEEYRIRLGKARKANDLGRIAILNRHLKLLYEEKLEMEGHAISLREYFRTPKQSAL